MTPEQARAEQKRRAEVRAARAEQESRAKSRTSLSAYVVRTSAPDYVLTPNHDDICKRLQRFIERSRAGESPRLILVMPPQRGKSHISTQRATTWAMGWWPGVRIGIAGYSQDIATYHSMRARQVAGSIEARSVWPAFGVKPQAATVTHAYDAPAVDTQDEWMTGGSSFVAVGMNVGLSGRPLDMLFVDDPHKSPDDYRSVTKRNSNHDWFHGVARARLSPGGGICFVSTPWGLDDLMERQKRIAREDPSADQYEVIRFPEIAEDDEYGIDGDLLRKAGDILNPGRHTLAMALATKATAPAWLWSTHYRCLPTSDAGEVVSRDDTRHRHKFTHAAAMAMVWDDVWSSCDPTFGRSLTSDFVAMQVWSRKDANRYLLDRVVRRMTAPELRQAYIDLHGKWPIVRKKLVEKTANGQGLYDDLHNVIDGIELVPVPTRVVPEKFQLTAYLWQSGNVWLPETSVMPDIGDYIEQIVTVPAAAHDDEAAATAHALSYSIQADTVDWSAYAGAMGAM